MTNKDYSLIASGIAWAHKEARNEDAKRGVESAALFLSQALGENDPKFDIKKFLAAAINS